MFHPRLRHTPTVLLKVSVFLLCLSVFLLTPAGAAKKVREPVTLRFNGLQAAEDSAKIEWRANAMMFKRFFQDRPYIKSKMLTNLRLPGEMNIQGADLTMSMVGDAAPDVIFFLQQHFAKTVDQGFLMELDDYVNNTPEIKKRLKGPMLELCSAIGPDGKKHIYALPWCLSADALVYNRQRFRDAGLTRPPADWDEMWEYSKKLYDADVDPDTGQPRHWAIQMPLEGWFIDRLPPYAGGLMWKAHPDGRWDTLIDSPASVKSLDFIKRFCVEPWTDSKGRRIKGVMNLSLLAAQQAGSGSRSALKIEGRDVFGTGIVAMVPGGLWLAFNERNAQDPLVFGVAQWPKAPGPDGRYVNKLGGQLVGIKSTISDKRVSDAAWEFLTFLSGDESERMKTKYFVDNGVARYVNPELLKRYGYSQDVIDQVPKDWARAYKDIFSRIYVGQEPPGMTAIEQELNGPCKALLRNERQDSKTALAAVQKTVSRSYLYTPTLQEMTQNRKIALVVVCILAAIMIAGGVIILRTQVREGLAEERERTYTRKVPRSRHILGWALMAPAVVSVFLWQYVPVAWGSTMAFMNVHILGGSEWVGMDNFIRVAIRPLYWLAWKNTFIYVVTYLAMAFCAPIVLALLLSEIPRGKALFRTLYYLPAVTTGVVTMLLWMRFYDPTQFGLMNRILLGINDNVLQHINQLLAFLHLPAKIPLFGLQMWLQDPKLAMASTILPTVWAGMGPGCIIYLAALKAVPEEQYDAADLDGAGLCQKAWHITLPTIFPLVLISFIGAVIGAFHSSGNILVMTGGGPNHATHVMGLEIFFQGYVLANYGQTTAIAWMLASLLVGFTVMQMKIVARLKFSTAEKQGD